ncbi:MAG: hypothetical protein M0D57_10005 [Sphingobacteriales bacterium JAD_PAG50586_3]|nr:MAG: hypothetical protein M0D57_10005 [Sphingobacteriales bacterium JAD_PAG50586_3]
MKLLMFFSCFLLVGCVNYNHAKEDDTDASGAHLPDPQPQSIIIPGEKQFKDKCASCHRVRGNVLIGPPLFDYRDSLKSAYKYKTKYHHDTTITWLTIDSLESYIR